MVSLLEKRAKDDTRHNEILARYENYKPPPAPVSVPKELAGEGLGCHVFAVCVESLKWRQKPWRFKDIAFWTALKWRGNGVEIGNAALKLKGGHPFCLKPATLLIW